MTFVKRVAIDYPGYYRIPGYSKYAINEQGNVIYLMSNQKTKIGQSLPALKPTKDNPLRRVSTTSDDGKVGTVRVNVLLCLAFTGPKPEGAILGRRDGDVNNESPDNLYWKTSWEKLDRKYAADEKEKRDHSKIYGFNRQTFEYIDGLKLSKIIKMIGVNNANVYMSARADGRPMRNGWSFSFVRIPEWEQRAKVIIN